jgi:hypothetical protein
VIRNLKAARALLRERGVLTLGELASAIAGGRIRGSWWSHAKGKLIFNIASALEDEPDVLACKLAGKATFVDRALWAALARVVTDASWRKAARAGLSDAALAVARRAGRGSVRLDKKTKKTFTARDKAALEKRSVLHITSEHTASGAHATVVRSWESWAKGVDVLRDAAKMTRSDAEAQLAARGLIL